MPGLDSDRSDNLPSNTLRDEVSAFVEMNCTPGDISPTALAVFRSFSDRDHPYTRAAQLIPYEICALTSDRGEKLFSDDGRDANVWE
jgi:hypothetical protein